MAAAPKKGIGSGNGTNANRTKSGGVSATARAKTGTGPTKAYPLPDKHAAEVAINERHAGKTMTAKQVLDKVAHSKFGKDPDIKKALDAARAKDAKR